MLPPFSPPASGHGLAAASLDQAFTALKGPFTAARQRYTTLYSFAGSQQLVAQLRQGARADVITTADRVTMAAAERQRLKRAPAVFARNKLAIVVGPGNPHRVTGLRDSTTPTSFRGLYAAAYRRFSAIAHPTNLGLNPVTVDLDGPHKRVQLEERPPDMRGPFGL